jgi:ABC-type branched-subunit amino acid transport system ATPase component
MEAELLQRAMELMEFTGLLPHKDKLARQLSSGFQKTLALTIALATNAKLLLLDEPVTTLSTDRVEMLMALVSEVRNRGTTVVIIEHNMKAIMDYCNRIVVLGFGKKIAEGLPEEIQENEDVVEAYLGD